MKRLLWIVPVLLLLLGGCENRQQVGICYRDCDDGLTAQYRQELEQALRNAGYAVTVMDAGNDQSKQDRQVAELIDKKTDLLILDPVMISALDNAVQQAWEARVPVVFVNREPDGTVLESWGKLCYVGYDTAQPGYVQGQMGLEGDLNGDGILSYAVIAGPEDHLDAQLRSDGCVQALKQSGVQTELLALEYGQWTRADAQRRCARLLATYGKDIEVIFCNSDELALGAMDAIRDGGRTVGQNIYLYGIDGNRQALFLIRSGDLSGTVSVDIPGQVEQVLSAARKLLMGLAPEKVCYIDHVAIDASNVEEFIED